jgi:hypothetical protein
VTAGFAQQLTLHSGFADTMSLLPTLSGVFDLQPTTFSGCCALLAPLFSVPENVTPEFSHSGFPD